MMKVSGVGCQEKQKENLKSVPSYETERGRTTNRRILKDGIAALGLLNQ